MIDEAVYLAVGCAAYFDVLNERVGAAERRDEDAIDALTLVPETKKLLLERRARAVE